MNSMPRATLVGGSSFKDAPNQSIKIGDTNFAYRTFGPDNGIPLVCLNHYGATLDNFDPVIMDALATNRRLVAVNFRGVGGSGGKAPLTVSEMTDDMIAFIRALGFKEVDLFGFSLGGFVAQDIVLKAPDLVRKVILAGTGPAGGVGIAKIGAASRPPMLKAMLTLKDPKYYLFFTSSAKSRRAAKAFLKRLKERKAGRDKSAGMSAFSRQMKAIVAWGKQKPQNLGSINKPVLVVNGDNDIMVPSENSSDLAHRIPGAKLVIYPDSGHGGIFQYHDEFIQQARSFLDA